MIKWCENEEREREREEEGKGLCYFRVGLGFDREKEIGRLGDLAHIEFMTRGFVLFNIFSV